jgi:Spy/CpxP family protein refolding chaperone
MKTSLRFLSLLGLSALAFAQVARAEENPAPPAPPAGQHPHGDRAEMRAKRLQDLTQKLSLTDAQQQQIKTIWAAAEEQGKALRDDESLSRDDRRAKMQAIMKGTHDQVRAILTPDQQKTFDAMPPPERRGHRGPPKGDGATPPPKPQ